MIEVDTYCATYCLKRAQVFAISMRDIQYHAKKEARIETDSKNVVLQKYHDFFDIFSKKDIDTPPLY